MNFADEDTDIGFFGLFAIVFVTVFTEFMIFVFIHSLMEALAP